MADPLPQQAYSLPTWVPEDLQVLHADLIARLRHDSVGLPYHNTIAELLIERIAFNYIVLKYKEAATAENGHTGFVHERNQKEFNTFWLTMTRELNAMIRGSVDADDLKRHIVTQVTDAIMAVTGDMSESDAKMLRGKFASEFADRGL